MTNVQDSDHKEEDVEVPWIEDADDDDDENNLGNDDDDDEEEYNSAGIDLFSTDHRKPQDDFTISFADGKHVTLTGIKAKYPHLLQSTGMTLWKGSRNLCDFLIASTTLAEQHNQQAGEALESQSSTARPILSLENKTVCELGAGLGLCGIVAYRYCHARSVVLTDGDTDTLANMRKNVSLNMQETNESTESADDRSILCKQLLWGKNVETFRDKHAGADGFDVVMGGDVAYAQEALGILFETTIVLLGTKSTAIFLLSFVFRGGVKIEHVFECAKQHKLEWTKVKMGSFSLADDLVGEQDDGSTGDGVYIFNRK
mmetsp:Transcript_21081/g.44050  ORF Transcript_21081/g.44050 Transcript_21081/m.44050 type:complete len:315 (-) Transcript_21081:2181-3125(-)|eukprot:CAMPEP_0172473008 /NCGR_PEP_ID=MMETSP1065-20121228/68636_1 /TAXON_ID=265537 /ORGANISM="Amphiprora paludosa, Strain CCMP125" /LENGTH=314 /DNA_ID=CAMNT_0013231177 /DNA_START=1 /DNA_END=945 /DNA_ORIENTATION=+